jgi:hypothetical protein
MALSEPAAAARPRPAVAASVVLWISRHDPLPAQLEELRAAYGRDVVVVKAYRRYSTAEEVAKLVDEVGARAVVAVLPLSFVSHLAERLRGRCDVLFPVMRTVLEARSEEEAERAVAANPARRAVLRYPSAIVVKEFKCFLVVDRIAILGRPLLENCAGGAPAREASPGSTARGAPLAETGDDRLQREVVGLGERG